MQWFTQTEVHIKPTLWVYGIYAKLQGAGDLHAKILGLPAKGVEKMIGALSTEDWQAIGLNPQIWLPQWTSIAVSY